MQEPQFWHHGLIAREWAEFETDGGPEAIYYKQLIEKSGQPALDLGCGSGQLLLPFLKAGLDVDGCATKNTQQISYPELTVIGQMLNGVSAWGKHAQIGRLASKLFTRTSRVFCYILDYKVCS